MVETLTGTWSGLVRMLLEGDPFLVALGLYLGMIATERVVALALSDRRSWRSDMCNIGVSTISAIVGALGLGVVFVLCYQFMLGPVPWRMPMDAVWAWAAVFLIHEFCYYLDHRLAHRMGFFWAFHQVHHAPNEMDLTVAARGSVFDGQVQWTYWVIAPLLGVPLVMLLAVRFFTNLWGIFNHTRMVKKMGVLENYLATPANHRVHHGRQPKYLDKNYSQVTVLFDRLFGSFQKEEEEPDYGLVERLESHNPVDHHLVGFRWLWGKLRQAPDWQARLGYLVRPPGWSHTGDHAMTESILAGTAEPPSAHRGAPLPAE